MSVTICRPPFCLHTVHRLPQPRSQGFSLLVGGYPNPILVINYHVHMIPTQRVKIWVLQERCLEFWLRILTCLFKKGGLFSILVQNSPKVTKKVLVFRKVARSCSLTEKLLKILKVAKKLPTRIWKGLVISRFFHIFYYYWNKESRSLYQGFCRVEVRYIEVPL